MEKNKRGDAVTSLKKIRHVWTVLMMILCASACKTITGGEEPADTDTHDDSGVEDDCGGLDEVCCAQNLCDDSNLICVAVTEQEALCLLQCVPPFCTEQGLDEALCQDVSDGAGLGACFSDEDLGVDSALESDNVCAQKTYQGFCCPRSMGGTDYGDAPNAPADALCNGVDMSTLEEATSLDDLLNSPVGNCLDSLDGTTQSCGVPCETQETCDSQHQCFGLFDSDGNYQGYGACIPDSYI